MKYRQHSFLLVVIMPLAGCLFSDDVEPSYEWTEGVFPPAEALRSRCETVRSGVDYFGNPYPDVAGTTADEKMWLRSWSNNSYLWYDEIVDTDPAPFTVPDYFDQLRTFEVNQYGNFKDRFHFSIPTDEFLEESYGGTSLSYGARFAIENGDPRSVWIVYVEPESPATETGVQWRRGTKILSVDGVSINDHTAEGIRVLNAGLFPDSPDTAHEFEVLDRDALESRRTTAIPREIVSSPVMHVTLLPTQTGSVAYLLFNTHIATAEQMLLEAFRALSQTDATDLIVDLRYNGGGLVAISSQLAFMIAGPEATAGKAFKLQHFNDKHPDRNPVTGQPLEPVPFYQQTLGFSVEAGIDLPTLGLTRVFVLTSGSTCSASEGLMNGLRGVGIEVVQIGDRTCGKPYGFYPADNCGTTYFSVQYASVNELGFGDYAEGFTPANAAAVEGVKVPGCQVDDDLSHGFGDPEERLLATALHYRETGECPPESPSPQNRANRRATPANLQLLGIPRWQQNSLSGSPSRERYPDHR